MWAHSFSLIAEHCEWFCSPVCRNQSVGPGDQGNVGITWLLPNINNLSCASDHASTANYPFPGRVMRKHGEVKARPGIFLDSTQHCHWVWKSVWPHCSVSTSLPSLLPNSTGGSPQTCATGGCTWGLAVCLHMTQWCHVPATSIKQRAHQCHDRWCTQCGCLQLAPSAANMQAVAAWGEDSVSRGFKWGLGRPCSSLFQSCPSGMLPLLASPSDNHNF